MYHKLPQLARPGKFSQFEDIVFNPPLKNVPFTVLVIREIELPDVRLAF